MDSILGDLETITGQCARNASLDARQILNCTTSRTGNQWQHANAVRTEQLKPAPTSVPWVTLNGNGTKEVQDQAQTNLVRLLCQTYKVIHTEHLLLEEHAVVSFRVPIRLLDARRDELCFLFLDRNKYKISERGNIKLSWKHRFFFLLPTMQRECGDLILFSAVEKSRRKSEIQFCRHSLNSISDENMTTAAYDYVNEAAIADHLKCDHCSRPFIAPMSVSCEHRFCRHCIESFDSVDQSCPKCRQPIQTLAPIVDPTMINSLNCLLVKCPTCSKTNIPRDFLDEHLENHRLNALCREQEQKIKGLKKFLKAIKAERMMNEKGKSTDLKGCSRTNTSRDLSGATGHP